MDGVEASQGCPAAVGARQVLSVLPEDQIRVVVSDAEKRTRVVQFEWR